MTSAVIRSISYDEPRNELAVALTTGRVYVYSLVPVDVAAAFRAAVSPGAFFNENIRDRYPFRKRAPAVAATSLRAALEASAEG